MQFSEGFAFGEFLYTPRHVGGGYIKTRHVFWAYHVLVQEEKGRFCTPFKIHQPCWRRIILVSNLPFYIAMANMRGTRFRWYLLKNKYWKMTDMVTVQGYEGSATFELSGVKGDVHLVDPMDGSIYEIPEDVMCKKENNLYSFKNLPVKDYPLIITFGEF